MKQKKTAMPWWRVHRLAFLLPSCTVVGYGRDIFDKHLALIFSIWYSWCSGSLPVFGAGSVSRILGRWILIVLTRIIQFTLILTVAGAASIWRSAGERAGIPVRRGLPT
jgi:hypothetical protein